MTRKWCNSCARFLDISEFWLYRRGEERRQQWCKSCTRAWRWGYREVERIADNERWRTRRHTRV